MELKKLVRAAATAAAALLLVGPLKAEAAELITSAEYGDAVSYTHLTLPTKA